MQAEQLDALLDENNVDTVNASYRQLHVSRIEFHIFIKILSSFLLILPDNHPAWI